MNDFEDFQNERGDLYEQIAELLTRLSGKELREIGGYEIIDPLSEKVLFDQVNA